MNSCLTLSLLFKSIVSSNSLIFKDLLRIFDLSNLKVTNSSYLDSKKSFIKWVHFIHNKINEKLEKPKISLNDFYTNYYENYKKKDIQIEELKKWKLHIMYAVFIIGGLGIIMHYHNK